VSFSKKGPLEETTKGKKTTGRNREQREKKKKLKSEASYYGNE